MLATIAAIALISAVHARNPNVYCRYATFEPNKATIADNWGKVDLSTGAVDHISINSYFLLGEITADGVSTVDPVSKVTYYANDVFDRYIYSAGTSTSPTANNLRPFFDLQAMGVAHLAFDSQRRQLIASVDVRTRAGTKPMSIAYPVDETSKVELKPFPAGTMLSSAGAYDAKEQVIYNLAQSRPGGSTVNITALFTQTGATTQKQAEGCHGQPVHAFIHQTTLYTVLEDFSSGKLSYQLGAIAESNGKMQCTPSAFPADGICTAFDSVGDELYYFLATNEGGFFAQFNVATHAQTKTKVQANCADMNVIA